MMKLDRQMKKIIAGVILGGALAAFTGCGAIGYAKGNGGHFQMSGDEMGMEAYTNSVIAIINETKTTPDIKSSYYQDREILSKGRIFRFQMPKSNGGSK